MDNYEKIVKDIREYLREDLHHVRVLRDNGKNAEYWCGRAEALDMVLYDILKVPRER